MSVEPTPFDYLSLTNNPQLLAPNLYELMCALLLASLKSIALSETHTMKYCFRSPHPNNTWVLYGQKNSCFLLECSIQIKHNGKIEVKFRIVWACETAETWDVTSEGAYVIWNVPDMVKVHICTWCGLQLKWNILLKERINGFGNHCQSFPSLLISLKFFRK